MARTPQDQLDTRAVEIAASALARIETHEAYCIRRSKEDRQHFEEMKHMIARVHSRIDEIQSIWLKSTATLQARWMVVSGAAILLLLGIIGALLTGGLPWTEN